LGKSMAESTLGMGKVCADCACAEPGRAIKIANAATAPIHNVFISFSMNRVVRLNRVRLAVFYNTQISRDEIFSRLRRELTILLPLPHLY
jgi:hypothetical protein